MIKVYDKMNVVIRTGDEMGYLVNPGDENMMANAKRWAYGDYETIEINNGKLELSILDAAHVSSQGGKLSFWTCEIKDTVTGRTFKMGVSSDSICDLIKNNTFVNGKCNELAYLVKSSASSVALTENMQTFREAKLVRSENVRVKRESTDEWKIGKIYETNTGKNPLLVVGIAHSFECKEIFTYSEKPTFFNFSSQSRWVCTPTGICIEYDKRKPGCFSDILEFDFHTKTMADNLGYGYRYYIVCDLEANGLTISDVTNKSLDEIIESTRTLSVIGSKKRVEIEANVINLDNKDAILNISKKVFEFQKNVSKLPRDYLRDDSFYIATANVAIPGIERFSEEEIREIVLPKEKEKMINEMYDAMNETMFKPVTFDEFVLYNKNYYEHLENTRMEFAKQREEFEDEETNEYERD